MSSALARAQVIDEMRRIALTGQRRRFTPREKTRFDELERKGYELAETLVADDARNADDLLPHQVPGARRYSVGRVLRRLVEGKPVDGLEGEVSLEVERRYARKNAVTKGGGAVHVPWDARVSSRALDTTAGAGAIVPRTDMLIDVLRSRLVLARLGARFLPDLSGYGALNMPRKSATATVSYSGDNTGPAAQSNMLIPSSVNITPTTLGAYTDVSRRYATLSFESAEALVIDDIAATTAHEIDRAALNGSGTANQPLGLFANPAVPSFPLGTNGAPPSYIAVVGLETALGNANADLDSLAFLTSPNGRSILRRTEKIATSGRMVWDENTVLSYVAEVSSSVPSNITKGTGVNLSAAVMGNFADMVIGAWGPPTLVVNPYLQVSSGNIRITMLTDFGVALRHEASFAILPDMVTT
jgi:HK97 family phage major capsid protein